MTTYGSARRPASRWLRDLLGSGLRVGAACAMALTFSAHAESLSLGSMTLYKTKGQPTYAEITLSGTSQSEAPRLRARVASPEAYRAAGLRYAPTLSQITVTPRQATDGRVGLRLDIPDSAADGSLDLLLLVGDSASVAMAEYRLDFTGTARVFPALEAGTALIPTGPQAATASSTPKGPTTAALASKGSTTTIASAKGQSTSMSSTGSGAGTGTAASTGNNAGTSTAATKPIVVAAAPVTSTSTPPTGSASAPAGVITTAMSSGPKPSASAADNLAAGQAAAAIAAWADAWSRRDVDAYVNMYVADFTGRTKPPSHATWVNDRRARIASKRNIEVRVSALSVIPRTGSNLMVLTFTQTYAGDGLRQTSQKRLTMRPENGRWLIQEETELP